MTAVDRVLNALEARECNPRGNDTHGWKALCPAHQDRNPSLKIDDRDGRVLLTCYAACTTGEVVAALGLEWGDLFDEELSKSTALVPRPSQAPAPQSKVVERYDYVDEQGRLLFQVERLDPKGFRQRKPRPDGGWDYRLGDTRRVLYRLPAILDAAMLGDRVILCEGEKDVHTLERLGMLATTLPGGAGKWRPEYSEYLRGARVAIVADVDPVDPKTGKSTGYEHARAVEESLRGIAAEVKCLQPTKGKDITEHLENGGRLSELVPLHEPESVAIVPAPVASCVPADPTSTWWVGTARELCALPDRDRSKDLLGPLITPGSRLMVAGATGSGKTTITLGMLSAIIYGTDFLDWHGLGAKRAMVLDVEQGRGTVQRRVREAGLAEADEVTYVLAPDGLALDADQRTAERLEGMFAELKPDVVLADPFYKLTRGDANDARAAVDLMRRFDAWREKFGFALLLPMHCRKPPIGAKFSINEIFGASAYQWGAEIVLGLQMVNRGFSHLHFFKDREGDLEAVGDRWSLVFDREDGFRRAPDEIGRTPAREKVREALEREPGLTIDQIRERTEVGYKTVRHVLDDLQATATDLKARVADRCFLLPPTLFEEPQSPTG